MTQAPALSLFSAPTTRRPSCPFGTRANLGPTAAWNQLWAFLAGYDSRVDGSGAGVGHWPLAVTAGPGLPGPASRGHVIMDACQQRRPHRAGFCDGADGARLLQSCWALRFPVVQRCICSTMPMSRSEARSRNIRFLLRALWCRTRFFYHEFFSFRHSLCDAGACWSGG